MGTLSSLELYLTFHKMGKVNQTKSNSKQSDKNKVKRVVHKEKCKELKSKPGKVRMVDDIVDKKFQEGSIYYLVISGTNARWVRQDTFTCHGTPTAKLYLKAFISGVKFGSNDVFEDDVEDVDLVHKIEQEFKELAGCTDPEEFCVGNILAKKGRKGSEKYLVKWIGFPREEATWEPKANLENSKTMVKIFESGVKCGKKLLAQASVKNSSN